MEGKYLSFSGSMGEDRNDPVYLRSRNCWIRSSWGNLSSSGSVGEDGSDPIYVSIYVRNIDCRAVVSFGIRMFPHHRVTFVVYQKAESKCPFN